MGCNRSQKRRYSRFSSAEAFTRHDLVDHVEVRLEQRIHGVGSLGVALREADDPAIEEHLLQGWPGIHGHFLEASV